MGLSTAAEVNDYMKTRSYVEGYAFSAKDVEVFGKIGLPDQKAHPHAYRWYVHTAALSGSKCLALVAGGAGSKPTPAPAKAAAPKKAAPAKPAPRRRRRGGGRRRLLGRRRGADRGGEGPGRQGARGGQGQGHGQAREEGGEPAVLCNLEIKPWEADQDLKALYAKIKKTVVKDGLKWSEGLKLVDVAFGVQKIICTAVVNQTLSMDAIIEEITEDLFADEVQSMSMTSMSLL